MGVRAGTTELRNNVNGSQSAYDIAVTPAVVCRAGGAVWAMVAKRRGTVESLTCAMKRPAQGAVPAGDVGALIDKVREFIKQPPAVTINNAFPLASMQRDTIELYEQLAGERVG